MEAYLYPLALAIISALVFILEAVVPWRAEQRQLRPGLWSDLIHLVINGHFLGVLLYTVATRWVLPPLDEVLRQQGLYEMVYRNAAASWPVWVQIVVALLAIDFIHWCVHNLLHRVPWLWELHKTHHSVKDGEMDWIVSFRFQWTEVVVYKTLQYLPLAVLGFGYEAVMTHAIFGTLIGHLNHANLKLDYGPLRYVLNNPRMHIWHHDHDATGHTTVNFGVIFSIWDWVFGTAYLPEDRVPRKLGFEGVDAFPQTFFGHAAWPFQRLASTEGARRALGWGLGAAMIGVGWAVLYIL